MIVRTGPHFSSRVFCSRRIRHQTTPKKRTTSTMVDSPEALKRQNKSVPARIAAEAHPTAVSNKRAARRKTMKIAR